jgi:NAD-dependent deacetylase
MIAADLDSAVDRLRALIAASSRIVPFTGAGISTECGIPDFRSPGGIWTRMRPIDFSDFLASQEARDESWRRRFAMEESFGGAAPGRGHKALASLYRAGKSPGVVTQNIDNLHQASGIAAEHVVELHGNTTYATVSFGQSMPEAAMRRAEELTLSADLFIAIGSSLVVWPAAGFPLMAKRNGARLVIINREPTDFDDVADLVARHDIGAVLEPFIAA